MYAFNTLQIESLWDELIKSRSDWDGKSSKNGIKTWTQTSFSKNVSPINSQPLPANNKQILLYEF